MPNEGASNWIKHSTQCWRSWPLSTLLFEWSTPAYTQLLHRKSSSQKFKVSTELTVSLPSLYIQQVWMRVVCLQEALTGPLLCGDISWVLRLGKDSGERVLYLIPPDYSYWHGGWPRGLGGKQPRPDRTRQASCPVVNSGLALFWETLASHDS